MKKNANSTQKDPFYCTLYTQHVFKWYYKKYVNTCSTTGPQLRVYVCLEMQSSVNSACTIEAPLCVRQPWYFALQLCATFRHTRGTQFKWKKNWRETLHKSLHNYFTELKMRQWHKAKPEKSEKKNAKDVKTISKALEQKYIKLYAKMQNTYIEL